MQDNSLYNTTIRENLLYANEDASEEDLISALQKAEAHFVFNLENELDTVI
jgi:ABC-type multidrug transport system fused ATPase/permease subunit|tara:strand:- start:523 stop:675 length:153 start_codon:yes stop_codon:yes gene_type:complete